MKKLDTKSLTENRLILLQIKQKIAIVAAVAQIKHLILSLGACLDKADSPTQFLRSRASAGVIPVFAYHNFCREELTEDGCAPWPTALLHPE